MAITLTQNYSAVVPNAAFVQFLALGGVAPYSYSVLSGGAGGLVNSSTGAYTAPPTMTAYPATSLYDTIQVSDSLGALASAQVLVATPLFLFCDIIQTQMNLAMSHCFLWDQKIFQPTDSDLYAIVSLVSAKPFGNSNSPLATDGSMVQQFVSMYARLDVDLISRGPDARDRKEQLILALNSIYAQQQQQANGFYIGKLPLPGGFINLSQVDGAAIPYRYKISYGVQYQTSLSQSVPYFNTFNTPEVYTNP